MKLWDGSTGHFLGTLDAQPDWYYLSPTVPYGIESRETLWRYNIQDTLPNSNSRIPLLWFPADTAHIIRVTFCSKSGAFGYDGRVIILDLSERQLDYTYMWMAGEFESGSKNGEVCYMNPQLNTALAGLAETFATGIHAEYYGLQVC